MAKIEVGTIILWSGDINSPPEDWALCDGSNGTPDLRDRFVVGAGSTYAVNATGGANTVTLSTGELPVHNHSLGTLALGTAGVNHTHTQRNWNISPEFFLISGSGPNYADYSQFGSTSAAGGHTHSSITGNTASAGSGQAHENRPAYHALAYIMKVA